MEIVEIAESREEVRGMLWKDVELEDAVGLDSSAALSREDTVLTDSGDRVRVNSTSSWTTGCCLSEWVSCLGRAGPLGFLTEGPDTDGRLETVPTMGLIAPEADTALFSDIGGEFFGPEESVVGWGRARA